MYYAEILNDFWQIKAPNFPDHLLLFPHRRPNKIILVHLLSVIFHYDFLRITDYFGIGGVWNH